MKSARLLWLKRWQYAIGGGAIIAGCLITPIKLFGETKHYIVGELSSDDATRVPCKLNNLGDIAGRAGNMDKGASRAAVWNRSHSRSKHLAVLPEGDYSSAFDINDAGEVAGVSNTGRTILPFIWSPRGGLSQIPLLPGDSCGQVVAINKHGHVVGYSSGSGGTRAVLWGRNMAIRNLGLLLEGSYSRAQDVNDFDEVVGTSGSLSGDRAVLWTKTGEILDLGTLRGDWTSEAAAINNKGDVVGYSKGPRGMRAFIWSRRGGMQELGVLPGGNSSSATDITDRGEVVGSSTSAAGEHAFIWTERTGIVDLNSAASADLGVVFIEANAINLRGQIVVMGKSAHGAGMSGAMASEHKKICAPAPPASFLLTPATTP